MYKRIGAYLQNITSEPDASKFQPFDPSSPDLDKGKESDPWVAMVDLLSGDAGASGAGGGGGAAEAGGGGGGGGAAEAGGGGGAEAARAADDSRAARADQYAIKLITRWSKRYGIPGKRIMEFLEKEGIDIQYWSQVLEHSIKYPNVKEPETLYQMWKKEFSTKGGGGNEPAAEDTVGSGANQARAHKGATTYEEEEQLIQQALAESMMLGDPQQDHRASEKFEEYYKKKELSPQEVNKMVVELQMMTGMKLTEAQEGLLAADFDLNIAINHYYSDKSGGAKNKRKTNTRRKKKKRLNKKKRSKKKRSKKKRSKKKSNKSRR